MSTALDIITRGVDSSGRRVIGTKQNFQFYDRVNDEAAEGLLVIVQGGWSFADASANTHAKGMCMDYRTWNLSKAIRDAVVKRGRDLMGTMWFRTEADGFDPHIHNNLIGDSPAADAAIRQVTQYKQGLNGLANRHPDRNPYRPKRIVGYHYLEGYVPYTEKDRAMLEKLVKDFAVFRINEFERDKAEAKRDKARFERLVTLMGNTADRLTVLINKTSDPQTKGELKAAQEELLLALKNDPDVTEKDNPSDDAMGEMNLG